MIVLPVASGPKAGRAGLASLTRRHAGAGDDASEAELSDELQKLGASISVSSAQYNNLITISSLADKLPGNPGAGAGSAAATGLREADFERLETQMLQGMKQEQQPEWLAVRRSANWLYGKQNRPANPLTGCWRTWELTWRM